MLLLGGVLAYRYAVRRQYEMATEQKHLEEIQHESEIRFRSIIEASPVANAVNDARLNITYLNSAFISTFGYSLSDIPTLEEWWQQAYPDPQYRQWVIATWQTRIEISRRDNRPFEPLEVNVRTKSGDVRTVLATASPLQSEIEGLRLVTLYDITERTEADAAMRQAVEEQIAIFEAATAGIAFVKHRVIVKSNRTLDRLFGYEYGEQLGLSTRHWYDDDEAFALGGTPYSTLARGARRC